MIERIRNYDNMTDLWGQEMMSQLLATREQLDFVASIDTCRYDNLICCDSMKFDFDLGRHLWLNKSRFTILQRDYLDLYQLELFLDRCESIGLGEAKRGVVTQLFAKQHAMKAKKYRWGNCMLGWSFRGGNKYEQPTLTMHSRVSYIAYIGGADLALCHVLAREIGNRIGAPVEDFAFRWMLDSSQFHFFKSIPALFRFDLEPLLLEEGEYPSSEYPTLKGVRKWFGTIVKHHQQGIPLEDQKYGPLKRIRRRYEEYIEGDLMPSVPITDLNFDPLRARG